MEEADVILVVGSDFCELSTKGWQLSGFADKIIHVDEHLEHFETAPQGCAKAYCRLSDFFLRLGRAFPEAEPMVQGPRKMEFKMENVLRSDAFPVKPQRLMYELNRKMPKGTRVLVDAGNAWSWATHYLETDEEGSGAYRIAMGF